jgi:hypothetical protein
MDSLSLAQTHAHARAQVRMAQEKLSWRDNHCASAAISRGVLSVECADLLDKLLAKDEVRAHGHVNVHVHARRMCMCACMRTSGMYMCAVLHAHGMALVLCTCTYTRARHACVLCMCTHRRWCMGVVVSSCGCGFGRGAKGLLRTGHESALACMLSTNKHQPEW